MPSDPEARVEIRFTLEVKRNLRRLAKKYHHIRSDLDPVIARLQAGEMLGQRIPGTRAVVYKVRVGNSDLKRGKRGGYRLVYTVQTPRLMVLLTVYSKTEQGDITPSEIGRILTGFEGRD